MITEPGKGEYAGFSEGAVRPQRSRWNATLQDKPRTTLPKGGGPRSTGAVGLVLASPQMGNDQVREEE